MDVARWLVWYFERLTEAIVATDEALSKILIKEKFWEKHKSRVNLINNFKVIW